MSAQPALRQDESFPRRVVLTPPEVSFAMSIATQRDASKKNRDSRLSRSHTGFGVHFVGAVGEICFRKVHGGKIDLRVLPDGDGHKPDIIVPDGRRIEVKTSTFTGKEVELKFEPNELNQAEYVSLVQVTLPDIGIVFPVWSWSEISSSLVQKDYGHGIRYVFRPQGGQQGGQQ